MIQRISTRGEPARQLAKVLGEALELVHGHVRTPPAIPARAQHPESLLQQCLSLCEEARAVRPDPLRSLHQFACTGGTLVGRCISAMPNVQLLSEVDPLSTLQMIDGEVGFAPTDFVQLLQQSSRGGRPELVVELFVAGLGVILADCRARGQRLVIRDHAHSKYCLGEGVLARPSVRDIISSYFEVRSAVTVRHPLDSFLSLRINGWLKFVPETMDEYASRYLAFLDDHRGLPVFRYEDIVEDPEAQVRALCSALEIPFARGFEDRFDQFRLTGDSGRRGGQIAPRARRSLDKDMEGQLRDAPNYLNLLAALGYPE